MQLDILFFLLARGISCMLAFSFLLLHEHKLMLLMEPHVLIGAVNLQYQCLVLQITLHMYVLIHEELIFWLCQNLAIILNNFINKSFSIQTFVVRLENKISKNQQR